MSLLVRVRELHRRIAPLVVLPLLITVCSGVSYRLARDWFGASRDQVHWLMVCMKVNGSGRRWSRWWSSSTPSVCSGCW